MSTLERIDRNQVVAFAPNATAAESDSEEFRSYSTWKGLADSVNSMAALVVPTRSNNSPKGG